MGGGGVGIKATDFDFYWLSVSAQCVSVKQFLNFDLLSAWPGVSAAHVSATAEKRVASHTEKSVFGLSLFSGHFFFLIFFLRLFWKACFLFRTRKKKPRLFTHLLIFLPKSKKDKIFQVTKNNATFGCALFAIFRDLKKFFNRPDRKLCRNFCSL